MPRVARGTSMSVAFAALLALCAAAHAQQPVDFNRDIRPIFNKNCVVCHGGIKQASGLSFILREKAIAPARSGDIAIRPGDPEKSELIRRIISKDETERMPPPEKGPALSDKEIAVLRQWIKEGAAWQEHWAYVAPKPQALPQVSEASWPRQPFDRFVLARLDQEKLKPSSPADRLQWLRRVSFDLTGLPPTPAEAKAFVDDQSPGAFEKVVDRLLASPAFGERWATPWLDVARYADTNGFERDANRTVWPYRDWLIRSLNADMPYDQFVICQIAGDLLPNATIDDRIATVFHRNTQTNAEGGTDDEEFRVAAVLDRVNTTWESMQGVTFRCTQCHSHPYDPFENDEYYRFYALFNTTRDWDLKSDMPLVSVPRDREQDAPALELDGQIRAAQLEERSQVGAAANKLASEWKPMKPSRAVSSRLTDLVLKPDGQFVDVVTEGTVSHGSRFTIDIPVPDGVTNLTALRVEGLPKNVEAALLTPELGFVISQLRMSILPAGTPPPEKEAAVPPPPVVEAPTTQQTPDVQTEPQETPADVDPAQQPGEDAPTPRRGGRGRGQGRGPARGGGPVEPPLPGVEIQFTHVFGDEVDAFQDPQASLNRDAGGWGALPRIDRPRHAVFTLAQPVELPAGTVLRLVMTFNNAANDDLPHVMNRGRFSISQSPEWPALVNDQAFAARRARIDELVAQRRSIPSIAIPVIQEQDPGQKRTTATFVRGSWLEKGKVVEPGVPKLLGQLPADVPADRMALAKWLVSKGNPLAARVAVNRFWEQIFGVGIVETQEDFGSSGTMPSHPELLDYLALRFQNELGWSVKKLLREIVLSAAYRQDSKIRPDLAAKDPANRLLARGPRTRLTAEMVRDQAMLVSGLLSPKMYGPPVMPPQPDGIWRSVYNQAQWRTSEGEDRYRRGLYTFWKRTAGYPSMAMFDAPSREICSARRISTKTPLQALVTLNDPVYMECATALAGRMITEGVTDPSQWIARGWELALSEKPSDDEVKILLGLYQRSLEKYQADEEATKKLGAASPQNAALTVVANTILNVDALMSK